MNLRRTLGIALLASMAVAVPASADPVEDLLVQAGDEAYATVVRVERQADRLVDVAPPTPPTTTTRTLDYYTDGVFISDYGSGPVIEYRGVLGQRSLWSCARTYGGSSAVTVTCTANPASGISWQCGVMHVNAFALARATAPYQWARASLASASSRRAPKVPNPQDIERGKVAGHVSCDGRTLTTEQANNQTPAQHETGTMGSVTTLVCEARLSKTSATAPVPAYAVNCVDPANPFS